MKALWSLGLVSMVLVSFEAASRPSQGLRLGGRVERLPQSEFSLDPQTGRPVFRDDGYFKYSLVEDRSPASGGGGRVRVRIEAP